MKKVLFLAILMCCTYAAAQDDETKTYEPHSLMPKKPIPMLPPLSECLNGMQTAQVDSRAGAKPPNKAKRKSGKKVVIDSFGHLAVVDSNLAVGRHTRKLQAVVADQRQVCSSLQNQVNEINGRMSDEALTEKIEELLRSQGINPATAQGKKAASKIQQKAKEGSLDSESVKAIVSRINSAVDTSKAALLISIIGLLLGTFAVGKATRVDKALRRLADGIHSVNSDMPSARDIFDRSAMKAWLKQ